MNRAPGTVWMLRHPNQFDTNGLVKTTDDDYILVAFWDAERGVHEQMRLSRGDARLLAKRLNQCLDRTVKR